MEVNSRLTIRAGIGNNSCITEIAYMVRTAFSVQHDIPVGPPDTATLEVAQDIIAVSLTLGPCSDTQTQKERRYLVLVR